MKIEHGVAAALLAATCLLCQPAEATTRESIPIGESPITIGVSPPRFEVEVGDRPTTRALRVFNFGERPMQITGSVKSWELDENNDVRVIPPTEQSLDQWIVINPLRFTVPPGESQTVRFSIRPKVRPEPGEHRAILYFQQAPDTSQSVKVIGRVGVAVYGYVGDVERVGKLHDVSVATAGTAAAVFDVSSHGNAHVRMSGQFGIWSAKSFPGIPNTALLDGLTEGEVEMPPGMVHVGYLPGLPVLPGFRRDLGLPLPPRLPPGDYILDVNGELSGMPLDLAVPFRVASGHESRAAVE